MFLFYLCVCVCVYVVHPLGHTLDNWTQDNLILYTNFYIEIYMKAYMWAMLCVGVGICVSMQKDSPGKDAGIYLNWNLLLSKTKIKLINNGGPAEVHTQNASCSQSRSYLD